MSIIDEGNELKLQMLLMMLGQCRSSSKDRQILVDSYTKACEALPTLKDTVSKNWTSLPNYDKKIAPYHLPDDYPFPQWFIEVVIRKPELLPIMELFPYMKDSYCNDSHSFKDDFLVLPLQEHHVNESLESALRYWHCTEEFLVDHLKRRDWLGLAGCFLGHLEDWRDASFYRAMACILRHQADGGVLDREVLYKLFETGFTKVQSDWHFYWPFMPRTLGYVINLIRKPTWETVQDMKFRSEWDLDNEWRFRLSGVKPFDATMAWLHDIILHKDYLTYSEKRALKEEKEEEQKRLAETEENSSKRQKVEVEISQ